MRGNRSVLKQILVVTCLCITSYFIMNYLFHRYYSSHQRWESMIRSSSLNLQFNKISERRPPCYIQIQQWVGSKLPQEPEVIAECPGLECGYRYIKDASFKTMAKSHVVLHDVLRSNWEWDMMQMRRPPNQAWVFWSQEAAAFPNRQYSHLYNYTITHRRRPFSTIYSPYGLYDNSTPQISRGDNRNWAQGRPNMVAWAASNCGLTRWRRFDFVKKLSEHIQVDIYGGCGKPGCERRSESCWNLLRTYKFYLALENSECKDYITEKFWENSLEHDLLPIVYGAPREDYEQVAPPHSFIHLQDFSSMEELVDYLNLVSSNDTLYNSYFEWKRHGTSRGGKDFSCDLVSKILDFQKGLPNSRSDEGANSKVYDLLPELCDIATGFPHDF